VLPATLETLVQSGLLSPPPSDPYGGRFFLEPDGKVATTSKFVFVAADKDSTKKVGK